MLGCVATAKVTNDEYKQGFLASTWVPWLAQQQLSLEFIDLVAAQAHLHAECLRLRRHVFGGDESTAVAPELHVCRGGEVTRATIGPFWTAA